MTLFKIISNINISEKKEKTLETSMSLENLFRSEVVTKGYCLSDSLGQSVIDGDTTGYASFVASFKDIPLLGRTSEGNDFYSAEALFRESGSRFSFVSKENGSHGNMPYNIGTSRFLANYLNYVYDLIPQSDTEKEYGSWLASTLR